MKMVVLKDWWTEGLCCLQGENTKEVIDQFDGQDSYGANINGKLTVSENVADLEESLQRLKQLRENQTSQQKEFFYNFGRIWRMKGRPEFMKL